VIAVDSSAIIAILRGEADADDLLRHLVNAESACLSALSLLEISMVLAGRTGDDAIWADLDGLIAIAAIEIVAFDNTQMLIARDAFLRFGKSRHKAALNLGDCVSYALAKSRDVALLYKGDDFAETDIPAVKPVRRE
jgi:ribonuclease VapC